MRKLINRIGLFFFLLVPSIVYAADFISCGNDKKIPFVLANIVSILFVIIRIVVPIIFVITGMISFFKASISSKVDDELNKAKQKLINNILSAVIIFFIVSIVNFVVSLAAGKNNSFSSCINCLIHPEKCPSSNSEIVKLCPGLISQQDDYDENCNYIGGAKKRVDYGSGSVGIVEYSSNSRASTASNGVISGNKYKSTVPLYNTSADLLSNINYDYYATVAQSGGSSSCPTFFGQCPWFAKGRALEIVANSDMPDDVKEKALTSIRNTGGNGGEWYSKMSSELFEKSTDIYAAKPGSMVSWSQGNKAGHVGIVEDVEYENGKAKRILLSESWNKTCQTGATSYSLKWWDVEQFRHYYGSHNFIGYVYLLG